MPSNSNALESLPVARQAPILSIVVATYNHEAFVTECLNVIKNLRNRRSVELIVIDDGSTDTTFNIVQKLMSGTKSSWKCYTKENMGLTDSLQRGLELASGEYVCFIASDDRYISTELERVIDKLLNKSDDFDLCIFQAVYCGEKTGHVYTQKVSEMLAISPQALEYELSVNYPRPLLLQSTIFKTSFLKKINPWRDRLLLDDWPTFLRVAQFRAINDCKLVCNLDVNLCEYRIHRDGAHKNLDKQTRACIQVSEVVVRPCYRQESKSNVYIDRSLSYAARLDILNTVRFILIGIYQNPSPKGLLMAIKRIKKRIKLRNPIWNG